MNENEPMIIDLNPTLHCETIQALSCLLDNTIHINIAFSFPLIININYIELLNCVNYVVYILYNQQQVFDEHRINIL